MCQVLFPGTRKGVLQCIHTGGLSGCFGCHRTFLSRRRDVGHTGQSRARTLEKLWKEFFSDPSQWWDSRSEKVDSKHPDFKHKETKDGLWVIDRFNPPWVEAELAAMTPGVLHMDKFSWDKKLTRSFKAGHYKETIELFKQMQQQCLNPDSYTFVPVLRACTGLLDLAEGRRIHLQIIQSGCETDTYVGSCLVDMYAKCGSIEDSRVMFDKMPIRNVVSWSAMILGYVKCGDGQKALELYRDMQAEGVEPNSVTFVGVLNACTSVMALEEGQCVHEQIIQRGYESDLYVGGCLVNMYAKLGCLEDAQRVFDKMYSRDVVTWTAMLMGYVKCGEGRKALELSRQMQQEGMDSSPVTFVALLNACASLAALEEGRRLHKQILERGLESDVFVGGCLVDMYAKCGRIEDAWGVFNRMPTHDVVSWTAMIQGFVKCAKGQEALDLCQRMQLEGVNVDPVCFVALLNACASVAALDEGRRLHGQVIKKGYESDVIVGSALIDMYAKCGSIEDAWRVFSRMPKPDMVSWNAMLGGLAMHGNAEDIFQHFKHMCEEGVEMNEVTFISLLSACSRAGLLEEGLHYLESMAGVYSVSTTMEHYACIIDLLSRTGHLQEAEGLITVMPCEPNDYMWMSLLSACRVYGNLDIGERSAKQLIDLDPGSARGHVMLSNLYAASCKWNSSAIVRQKRLEHA